MIFPNMSWHFLRFTFNLVSVTASSESQWGFGEMVARQEFLSDSDALVRLQK